MSGTKTRINVTTSNFSTQINVRIDQAGLGGMPCPSVTYCSVVRWAVLGA